MVNPTGSSQPNPSGTGSGTALPGLRLRANSADTIRFLAGNAGKLIEARVIDVLTRATAQG
ncbi:MAG: hypothetical protein WBN40_09055, partial [Pseudomonadales bacterium]